MGVAKVVIADNNLSFPLLKNLSFQILIHVPIRGIMNSTTLLTFLYSLSNVSIFSARFLFSF